MNRWSSRKVWKNNFAFAKAKQNLALQAAKMRQQDFHLQKKQEFEKRQQEARLAHEADQKEKDRQLKMKIANENQKKKVIVEIKKFEDLLKP